MAECARRGCMRAGQRETRGAVVKLSVHPRYRVMARCTLRGGESRRNVIRYVAA
jgi:hypothetical protein